MEYIKVRWIHTNPSDPVWLYSELAADRMETRKVENWINGNEHFADASAPHDATTQPGIIQCLRWRN